MTAEYVAEHLMDALPDDIEGDALGPSEDLRSGGYFFDVTVKGRQYEVLVVEVH